jgi:hypothetical protein
MLAVGLVLIAWHADSNNASPNKHVNKKSFVIYIRLNRRD